MNVLTVKKLGKTYLAKRGGAAYPALREVDLSVEEGDFLGIMGPSGAGKTTLLNLIATIDSPSSGSILYEGEEVSRLGEGALADFRRRKLGFIFQDFNLLDTLTIGENIALPLALAGHPRAAIEARLEAVAAELEIGDILGKRPWEASGGQKQRAAAARAVISEPRMILADEPTGALDSRSARELLECLGRLNEKRSATILLVTHDPFAASYAKRIVFIKDGRLHSELRRGGSRKEFFDRILEMLSAMGGTGDGR